MKLITKTTKKMWDYLMEHLDNAYVVAALLGTMYEVSKFESQTDYTRDVIEGKIPMHDFTHDGIPYGICGWKKWTNKQGLYNIARKNKKSIASLDIQLHFIWDQLHEMKYKQMVEEIISGNCDDLLKAINLIVVSDFFDDEELLERNRFINIIAYATELLYQFAEDENSKLKKEKKIKKNEDTPIVKKILVARMNNVGVHIADSCKSKLIGNLDTSKKYEYVTDNETRRWHCIVFEGKLRWVSGKNTQVINA